MPEYLAPGVYVEETSFRSKSIEGVSTSTTGFVGPTRYGPTRGVPELVTSFADFTRVYGGYEQLTWSDKVHNFVAHAVRAFFDEGGQRLYVARVFTPKSATDDGIARAILPEDTELKPDQDLPAGVLRMAARYPGAMGNMRVTFSLRLGQNILVENDGKVALRGIANYDVLFLKSGADAGKFYLVEIQSDGERTLYNLREQDGGEVSELSTLVDATKIASDKPEEAPQARVLTVDVSAAVMGTGGVVQSENTFPALSFHSSHANSLVNAFPAEATSKAIELYVPIVMDRPNGALALVAMMMDRKAPTGKTLREVLDAAMAANQELSASALTFRVMLKDGNDGQRPDPKDYVGDEGTGAKQAGRKSGLTVFRDVDDISIVAAPGCTYDYKNYTAQANSILRALITHCEQMRYRVAILDSAEDQLLSEIRAFRAQLDSTHAALYYPWLRVLDPVTGQQIHLPPSGFVAGIYARNDTVFGAHKAPANEPVRSAIGLKVVLNKGQQDVLNPEGINCFRAFEGRGIRLWGARTISSDPEWKYVNLRRYFAYLEHSIDKNTQWVVFMNNDQALWANVAQTIEDFLYTEWKNGRLMGATPQEAYFVRCDRSTMTQNDIDNGRLICLIGASPVRPAEFVIFRIGQYTATK